MDVVSQTSQSFPTIVAEFLMELGRSFGTEFGIFALTFFFALVIRNSRAPTARRRGKKCEMEPVTAPQKLRATTPSNFNAERSLMEPRRPRVPVREPWMIIDEVCDAMLDQPGSQYAARALTTHKELIGILKERGITMAAAARCGRHAPIDFYSVLTQCTLRIGRPNLIQEIFDDMTDQGVGRTLSFYEGVMKQLAGQKHYHIALGMYDRLIADGFEPSAVTCSCLINFAAEVGELKRAVTFFEKLKTITTPSIRAYMTVLRVHSKCQDWHSSLAVLRDMQNRGARLDSLVLNIALATGVACDQLDGVEALILEAETAKPNSLADIVSYNTLTKGFAQRGDAVGARKVLDKLRKNGPKPNAITFNTAMDAAVRGSRGVEAWSLLKEMRDSGIKPDKFTCSILVKGLPKSANQDRIKDVLTLLHGAESSCDMTLASTMYHTVLDAATQCDHESVALVLRAMQRHSINFSPVARRLMSQIVGQHGQHGGW